MPETRPDDILTAPHSIRLRHVIPLLPSASSPHYYPVVEEADPPSATHFLQKGTEAAYFQVSTAGTNETAPDDEENKETNGTIDTQSPKRQKVQRVETAPWTMGSWVLGKVEEGPDGTPGIATSDHDESQITPCAELLLRPPRSKPILQYWASTSYSLL